MCIRDRDIAALRDVGDAEAGAIVRRHAAERGAVQADRAAGDRLFADDGAQEAGLADTVAPHEGADLADLGGERDVAECLGGAVIQIDVLGFEHRGHGQRPRYTSTTRGSAETWSSVPSEMTLPSWSTVTLTPRARTKVMSCSTTTTDFSRAMPLSSSAVASVSASVMPAAGSSTSSNLGSCASSMPISSHCFWPWLR